MSEQLYLFETANPFRERFQASEFSSAPETPGLYWMTNRLGQLLYIGKAKNLKRRLKSYRNLDFDASSSKIQTLLAKAERIQWMKLDTETTALIEESKRIREYSPPCNTVGVRRSKDIWIGVSGSGEQLVLSVHFDIETRRPDETVFGPYRSIAQTLLVFTALTRRSWAIANESAEFPPQLLRKIAARRQAVLFPSSEKREAWTLSLYAFLIGLGPLYDFILPEEEPSPFDQVIWRNDEARLLEFYRRRERAALARHDET